MMIIAFFTISTIIIFKINERIFEGGFLLKNGNRLDVPMGMLKRGSTKYYIFSLFISCSFVLIWKLYDDAFFQVSTIALILSIPSGRRKGQDTLMQNYNKPF